MKINSNLKSNIEPVLFGDLKPGDVYRVDNGTKEISNPFLKITSIGGKGDNSFDLVNNKLGYHYDHSPVIILECELKIYGEKE